MKTYNYQINEDGSIISNYTGKQLAITRCKKGYNRVRFKHNDGGVTYLVHRVIAIKFIPNPLDLPQVNHKDGDKDNNSVKNLEWCTGKRNVEHSKETGLIPLGDKRPNAKFSDEQVKEIRQKRNEGLTYYQLADLFGASYQGLARVCNHLTYKHVG